MIIFIYVFTGENKCDISTPFYFTLFFFGHIICSGEKMNKDLTVGNPRKVLVLFCLPLLGSMVFQQLYNLADSFVAGKFIGESALAAVGNGYEITLIFLAFAMGCNIGCSVVIGQFFGAGKIDDLKTAVYTTFISVFVLCAVLMTVGLVFCNGILRLINTPESLISPSALYLRIYIYSLPFVFLYNVSTGIFSALGDSLTPFCFLAASSLSNIGADILFVAVFKMGIAGVAWATFMCQGVSCALSVLFVILRLRKMKTERKVRFFSAKILAKISIIAIPSILQQSFISIGNIIIQSVINTFGESVIAGYSGAIKLNSFAVSSLVTMSSGMSSFASQNLGAKKIKRISTGFGGGIIAALVIAAPLSLIYALLGKYLLLGFLDNPSGEALAVGARFLLIVAPFYPVVAVKLIADGALRGTGNMLPFAIATFCDLLLRVALSIILSRPLGTDGIWISWPIGWVVATIKSVVFYALVIKKLKKTVKPEPENGSAQTVSISPSER